MGRRIEDYKFDEDGWPTTDNICRIPGPNPVVDNLSIDEMFWMSDCEYGRRVYGGNDDILPQNPADSLSIDEMFWMSDYEYGCRVYGGHNDEQYSATQSMPDPFEYSHAAVERMPESFYPKNFEKAMKFLFGVEKGYSNNAKDSGGPTNLGITQNTLTAYRNKHHEAFENVKKLPRGEATQIYYKEYWIASHANQYSSYGLSLVVFDIAVNSGVGTAKRLKKNALDKIGINTSELELTKEILREKLHHYQDICKTTAPFSTTPHDKINLDNRHFFVGWVNRTEKLCDEIGVKKFWADSDIKNLIKSWGIHADRTPQYNW